MSQAEAAKEQPIRPAATVVLARDRNLPSTDGARSALELFMLKRTAKAVFAGGMYVFPGGRVDPEDGDEALIEICSGPDEAQARQVDALGQGARAFYIAALRECFEEAGYLLAYDRAGQMVSFADPAVAERFQVYRDGLNAGQISLPEICRREQLRLALDRMHFYHRWITPPGRPRRFDTRFFFAAVPAEQSGRHDDEETVASTWIAPSDALTRHEQQAFDLMAVTKRQLGEFAEFRNATEMVTAARDRVEHPTFRPTVPTPPPS